ncbi:hypothetical protein YYC_04217 [Plasmodium yoelii 17X]|uniref:Uncharacterized protein n=4 Tax=Plasmodium yoelii TaxID=5861 RepID=A0AAE9WUA3_PLAYO|nr:Plasmodium exported protein, unknown function [Plasmodium yoelii]EAA20907.1 hypothetical protein [Plasmodium yoelii yoelii]ETB58145.1 hypothetical protein YYC_04217 [Plasmodium yoelii 17X]WBY59091.1 hypothetical protein Py17XNL_001204972 [Plasmodium yoelii yoelii]CDU19269.1 Plasmodium exported protein, unknown function [Plasmodium yoelii]VTZ79904.1 Plasmodium exported protein, unknown function [Plasmodium yoelii]|eukprot:XP_729342.1 Plasmodium exported protein, unknown function [Plasmodium yoelii]
MGVIKHKIFMVLKIVNIILFILSTQIPFNNNEINNFRKIIGSSSFKYTTRILCCASFKKKFKKFCKKAFCCYKNQCDDKNQYDDKYQCDDESLNGDESMDYSELLDDDRWGGIYKNKLDHIVKSANRVDIKSMSSCDINKALLPFRINDEEIENFEVTELIRKVKSREITITPKVASLIFYDFHIHIHKDIQILFKRARKRLNALAIQNKFSRDEHTLCTIAFKKVIFRKSICTMYRSLRIYEEYAISYIDHLIPTFHIFLKQYCDTICIILKKIELTFFRAVNKMIATVDINQIRLIEDDEKELFFFT